MNRPGKREHTSNSLRSFRQAVSIYIYTISAKVK